MRVLDVHNLGIGFGGLQAVDDFNLQVESGEIVGLIGPNGAGKTTIFNLLTNVYKPSRGSIKLTDVSILGKCSIPISDMNTLGKAPHEVARSGIARTFQNIRLFKNMSVLDNVKVALHNGMNYSIFEAFFRLPRYWREE